MPQRRPISSIRLKDTTAARFIASALVDSHGREAVKGLAQGSPIMLAVEREIRIRNRTAK